MGFQYKKVHIIRGTSGIGAALADKLVENGVFIVVVGRRRDKLEAFVKKHGQGKADFRVFDINQLDAAPKFVDEVFKAHSDIDFVFLNVRIQRGLDFTKPESVDLSTLKLELRTNYIAPVHLTKAILPHLTGRSQPTAVAYTSSQLGIIILNSRMNYGASKAAIHSFMLSLRAQLSKPSPNLKVIEVYPPAVQTEMPNSEHRPDLKDGDQLSMPLADFTSRALGRPLEQQAGYFSRLSKGYLASRGATPKRTD